MYMQYESTFHAVLGGLGLLLTLTADYRNHGHMNNAEVLGLDSQLQLPKCLNERHRLNIPYT